MWGRFTVRSGMAIMRLQESDKARMEQTARQETRSAAGSKYAKCNICWIRIQKEKHPVLLGKHRMKETKNNENKEEKVSIHGRIEAFCPYLSKKKIASKFRPPHLTL